MAKKIKKNKPRIELTLEEKLSFELENIRKKKINPPSIKYTVGQKVICGHVTSTVITDILDDGKILKVHEVVVDNNYGNPKISERDRYLAWHEVRPILEKILEKKSNTKDRLSFYSSSIDGLLNKYYYFGVNMDPDYQRKLVWDLSDKQNLIESIFNNIDIGKFVFANLPFKDNSPCYEIVDGKQRLSTLIEFYEGRFMWQGVTYHQLHPMDINHFESYLVSFAELVEPDKKNILETFIKINTTGRPQDNSHLEYVRNLLRKEEL